MSEWKKHKLGELCTDINYGYTASANNVGGGPKFLRITDIVPQRIDWAAVPYCEIDVKNSSKYKLEKGDIVIARTGATTGYNYTFNDDVDAVFASYLIRYRIDHNLASPFYVGYSLKSENWKGFVENIIGGSAQPGANAKMFADFDILLPPKPTQEIIVETLSALDDKIDLLHRQNKTLEELAETLFRQWFVKEVDDSWETKTLDDIVSVKGGTTPSTKEPAFWDGNVYWTSPRDLTDHKGIFLFDTQRKITEEGLAQIGSGLLPIGTVLLSSRAPIGYLAITEIPVAINQGYIAIICNKVVSNYFIYLWCKQNMPDIENAGNGSVFQEISKSTFKGLSVTLPKNDILKKFDTTVTPFFVKIKSNSKQIRTLTQLRDTLLPKLMNGDVRVR